MKPIALFSSAGLFLTAAMAQHNASTANGCNTGYFPGSDTVIYTVPHNYTAVMSIIGSYRNLTWSGNTPDTVTLSGPDNTVGTSRTYDTAGAHVIETITVYSKPPNGPYEEIHTLAPLTIPAAGNLSFYGDYDGTTVVEICNGKASTFNFTINFCATNASLAASVLHQLHLTDATTVGVFLGNQNFTTCAALGASGTANASSTTTGTSATSTPTITIAGASMVSAGGWGLLVALAMGLVAATVL